MFKKGDYVIDEYDYGEVGNNMKYGIVDCYMYSYLCENTIIYCWWGKDINEALQNKKLNKKHFSTEIDNVRLIKKDWRDLIG